MTEEEDNGEIYNEEEDDPTDEIYDEDFQDPNYNSSPNQEGDGTFEFSSDADQGDPRFAVLEEITSTYCAYMCGSPASLKESGCINVEIPRTFLPMTLQAVYGFYTSDMALVLEFELYDFNWKHLPNFIEIKHPITGAIYTGNGLTKMAVANFFSPFYEPKKEYRSARYFLCSAGSINASKIPYIENNGFTEAQARRALLLCNNNIEQSIEFLRTGELYQKDIDFSAIPKYRDCPLIYLVLEIADAILDLQDHCSICRCLTTPGLKPTICNKPTCQFSFSEIGVGTSVIQEIKRDPIVADLLFSIFSCSIDTPYMKPAPPIPNIKTLQQIVSTMPSMSHLEQCSSDQELFAILGEERMTLLRWVLLSNRAQFFHLPSSLQVGFFKGTTTFMALISSPEAENTFQQLKSHFKGSTFLWHGSSCDRWHSIIHNGLKNATGTALQQNGSCYGPGIYFAKNSGTSINYSIQQSNGYKASKLGQTFQVLALCEVANLPQTKEEQTVPVKVRDPNTGETYVKHLKGFLHNQNYCHTMTFEEACVVRFLVVNPNINVDVQANRPTNLPTVKDILNYQLDKVHKT